MIFFYVLLCSVKMKSNILVIKLRKMCKGKTVFLFLYTCRMYKTYPILYKSLRAEKKKRKIKNTRKKTNYSRSTLIK